MSESDSEPRGEAPPEGGGAPHDRAVEEAVELGASTEGPLAEPLLLVPPAPSTGPVAAPVLTEATRPPARHGRLARHGTGRVVAKALGTAAAVVAVSATAVASFAVVDVVREIKPAVELESEKILDSVPDIGAMEGGLNFLLVGSDKRPQSGAFGDPEEEAGVLNDVTMLLHIAEDHSHVEVVSFPRDMLVDVPACPDPDDPSGDGFSERYGVKLNTILHDGGLNCVAATIEQMLGVKIPVGGIVEFDGVAALSEAVGGVEVCLVDPIDDPWSGLQLDAGRHTIHGYQALAFLRTRHGVGDGSDLGRISNQQTFLASLARTLQSQGTLGDPVKLYSIAKAVLANMTLSKGLQDPARLVSIARAMQAIDLDRIAFIQYPTYYTDDFSAVLPAESGAAVASALQRDVPVGIDPAATSQASYGTADPDATEAPVQTDAATAPSGAATPAPSASAGPGTVEALPGDITGQTADEVRCSTANDG
ncbi:LCP family protein [Agromyces aurantiacus]|uniref:LCP family protein n=1 Tax=Agromyces aurantiacus TaxID=165814 RepID=A0ABV9R4X7_9MICO|nr:LCP family protein [Agromyces aurantiacus]MBM7503186.1 LCP family protein required for cell wall assembly [Agromyces aurantiacus]